MWINPMLTIWLYGTVFSLAAIVFTLWLWYWRDAGDSDSQQHSGPQTPGGVEHHDGVQRRSGDAAQ